MVSQAQLDRGKKWAVVRRRTTILAEETREYKHDLDWMDSQAEILKDEKAYADSLKPKPEKKVDKKVN